MRRIHPKNGPVLQLPKEHPAHATRLECQLECAGGEIGWPGHDGGVEQEWHSLLDGRERTFSGFIYEFVCFDLILTEWIEHPPYLTVAEENALSRFPKLLGMLDECESAAVGNANGPILRMLPLARRFFTLWEDAIRLRIEQDRLSTGINRGEDASVADFEGPWADSSFESGLIDRCKRYWSVPIVKLPNTILAMYIRQRIALSAIVPEARRRLSSGLNDDSEVYEGELVAALIEVPPPG